MEIDLNDYNYSLPKELIAQSAFHPRDHCRLMILHDGKIEHKKFYEIIDYLEKGDVLVVNETKVSPAKLMGKKETGGKVEVILTKELKNNLFECRIKGSKIREHSFLFFKENQAEIVQRKNDLFFLKFKKAINKKNLILPTPPYIKKEFPEEDYQTVFAKKEGSLAAPTAGLHFTPELLKRIEKKGIKIAKIRLDISYETFLPVRDVRTHRTGKEYFEIDAKNAGLINSGKIIAVGTTVVKCLESARRKNGKILPTKKLSEIFIKPGYRFKTKIKAMVTNFHLPKSSLLLLTSAYAGRERILKAYEEAVREKYRFFSLGDGMIIFSNEP